MAIRLRLRGPTGTHTLSFDDNATISDLCSKITELTELLLFELKSGFPPKLLDISDIPLSTFLKDLPFKLNGEQIIVTEKIVPGLDIPSKADSQPKVPSTQSPSKSAPQKPLELSRKSMKDVESDPPEVRVPFHGGRLVLRVMPDDNSCLFRALGSCLMGNAIDATTELRSIVAAAIQADPEKYNAAILQKEPDSYCQWIQNMDSWGGYIETAIISQHFGVNVVALDVESGKETVYAAEGAMHRCYIVYSGIHYDALALIPDGIDSGEVAFDTSQFDENDTSILQAAQDLGKVLRGRNYFTNTSNFAIKCEVCGWKGKGEKDAQEHGNRTGHGNFSEA
jgi:ubiquitin thioesterase OTU1